MSPAAIGSPQTRRTGSTLIYLLRFSIHFCIASEFSVLPDDLHGLSSLHDAISYMLPTETNNLTFIGQEKLTSFHFNIFFTF